MFECSEYKFTLRQISSFSQYEECNKCLVRTQTFARVTMMQEYDYRDSKCITWVPMATINDNF